MKIIKLNNEARKSLIAGANKVVDAVKLTLGVSGYNAVLGREYSQPIITNDGVSIARDITLDDEIENLGAEVIKSVSINTDKGAGDGTTTSMVLAQKILEAGFKFLAEDNLAKKPAVHVKQDISKACKEVVEKLKALSIPVKSTEDIYNVAFTSLEDKQLATILTELAEKIGHDGLITVEEGEFYVTESRIEKGIEIEEGLVSPYLGDNGVATMKNVAVLVTNTPIQSVAQIAPFSQQLAKDNELDLVIFAPEFSGQVVSSLVMNKLENNFRVIAVKCDDDEVLKDIALITGATFIDKNGTKDLTKAIEVYGQPLGRAEKVESEQDKTVVIGDGKADTSKRVAQLKEKLEDASDLEKSRLRKLISSLDKGVGIIKVGASSQEERDYIRLKLEDGINAVKSAMELGIVPGGGLTLYAISEEMPESILATALKAPYMQIQENAGGNLEIPATIVDPVKTLITALENACSAAGVLLTAGIAIANKNEDRRTLES